MSEVIPEGWEIDSFEKNIDVLSGFPFKSAKFSDDPSKIGLIRIRDLVRQKLKTFYDDEYSEDYIVKKGDVLIGMDGDFNVVRWKVRDALLNQRICKVSASEGSNFNTDFIFHTLFPELKIIHDVTGATTVKHLSVKDIRNIEKPFPPLPEQQKIASILTSVDEVIEKTEAQISKLQHLKKGMMQELLTKGIGHTEFKDSPVGRIPKEWNVVALGEVGKWKGGGTPSKSNSKYWSGNIPWVSPKDMKSEYITKTKYNITEDAISGSSANKIKRNSLLMVVRSGILKHTLPIAISGRDLTINQDMKALSVSAEFSVNYIFHYLHANNKKVLRATLKAGNTVESIDFNELSKYLIPHPSFEEQVEIANAVDSIGTRIGNKKSQLMSFVNIKKALMQDLLTGKVRVKVD